MSEETASPILPINSTSRVTEAKPQPRERNRASIATGSVAPITGILNSYLGNSIDSNDIMERLHAQSDAVLAGDMGQVESMLLHQAVALQGMFANLAVRARHESSLPAIQTMTQLALKAQSGCRATLQALAEVKSPKQVAFVKQANIAQNQQVNNGTVPSPRERNIKPKPIELLAEERHGSTEMDTRAKGTAGGADQDLVAVDTVNGAAKSGRKATRGA